MNEIPLNKKQVGFAMSASFCTFKKAVNAAQALVLSGYDVTPIMSFNASNINTRFGKADDFIKSIEEICCKPVIKTIEDAEPIGPNKLFDILVVAPCTGNTLAKLANSIVDTPVTMAVKSHIRNSRPVLIAVSTNDGLSGSAKNIGELENLKNYFFVPMKQDDFVNKPTSLIADFDMIPQALELALIGKQIQPMF